MRPMMLGSTSEARLCDVAAAEPQYQIFEYVCLSPASMWGCASEFKIPDWHHWTRRRVDQVSIYKICDAIQGLRTLHLVCGYYDIDIKYLREDVLRNCFVRISRLTGLESQMIDRTLLF